MCGELTAHFFVVGQGVRPTMAACAHIASLLGARRVPEVMAVVGVSTVVAGRLVHRRSWAQSSFEAGLL
jgi:hypothetical protein